MQNTLATAKSHSVTGAYLRFTDRCFWPLDYSLSLCRPWMFTMASHSKNMYKHVGDNMMEL